jgi:phosphatidate cytidylyltransferase
MLLQRVITALVLAALVFSSMAAPHPGYFQALLATFGVLAAWEWNRLMGFAALPAAVLALLTLCAGIALYRLEGRLGLLIVLSAACLIWLAVVLPTLWGGVLPSAKRDSQTALLGAVIILAAMDAANQAWLERGAVFLISLLLVVVMADIFAYAVGKSMGRRKLAPSISPGKSWEGALGGAIAVAAYGLLCMLFSNEWTRVSFPAVLAKTWGIPLALLMLMGLAAASVVGDLFESMLKRRAGQKDSSKLLPGHGGVLDRIDAQLPVLPIAVLLTWNTP